jgi:hypothetical protein
MRELASDGMNVTASLAVAIMLEQKLIARHFAMPRLLIVTISLTTPTPTVVTANFPVVLRPVRVIILIIKEIPHHHTPRWTYAGVM